VPGDTTTVPVDPDRAHLRASEMIERLAGATGVTAGERLNLAADVGGALTLVVLDSVDRAGGAGGVITGAELAFLRRALRTAARGRSIVVASHHGPHRARNGAAAQRLLDGDDRVIAELHGDTHRHEVRPVRTPAGGYWRIGTASLADWPQQGRMLRLVEGAGGARALETWVVDHTGGPGDVDLPGAARRLAYLDAQGGRPQRFAARRTDRNARLWLPRRAG
jgi:hypothetical protein